MSPSPKRLWQMKSQYARGFARISCDVASSARYKSGGEMMADYTGVPPGGRYSISIFFVCARRSLPRTPRCWQVKLDFGRRSQLRLRIASSQHLRPAYAAICCRYRGCSCPRFTPKSTEGSAARQAEHVRLAGVILSAREAQRPCPLAWGPQRHLRPARHGFVLPPDSQPCVRRSL